MITTNRRLELLKKYNFTYNEPKYLSKFILELTYYYWRTQDKEETINYINDFISYKLLKEKSNIRRVIKNLTFGNCYSNNRISVSEYGTFTNVNKFLWNVLFLTLDKMDKLENENI